MRDKAIGVWKKVNQACAFLDNLPLWLFGFLLLAITFLPYLILGEGSVFEIHDQLDETLLTYVLNARHMWTGDEIFPELLGGINKSGMQPSAVLFIPLYRYFNTFTAFVVQYAVVWAAGFFGMYFCTRELTGSSILSFVLGAFFCMLPIQPVYGLSILGVPMLFFAWMCLEKRKHLITALLLVLLFGLTTHLVLIGYVVLSLWALRLVWMILKKKHNYWVYGGFALLLCIYLAVNWSLFVQLLVGEAEYVSHREELVNYGQPFWETVKEVFLNSAQHAPSYHKYMLIPLCVLLLWNGICYRRMDREKKRQFLQAVAGLMALGAVALLYGVCKSQPAADFKNSLSGFLRYFQLERYYWLYPSCWLLELALALRPLTGKNKTFLRLAVAALILLPMFQPVKINSSFYRNVNQINNGSGVTGYVTWESYYAEDLMQQLEDAIGRNMEEYRVAHLGVSPAPSLMHGFYTADGYSNNYPLEYKHRFRQVIAEELRKNEGARLYFDEWGSRCYLFNSVTGTYWNLEKGSGVVYENLDFDMEALKALGCEYLFSGGEIVDAERMGLESMGYYETETSFWGIWLYRIP